MVSFFNACWHGHKIKPIVCFINEISNKNRIYHSHFNKTNFPNDKRRHICSKAQQQCNNTRTHTPKSGQSSPNCQRHTQQSMRCYRVFFFFSCSTCKFAKQNVFLLFVIYIDPLGASRSLSILFRSVNSFANELF